MTTSLSILKKIIFCISILFFTANCKKDDPLKKGEKVCGVTDPINDLKWLNDQFKLLSGGPKVNGIVLYKFNDQDIIEIQSSLSSSTNMHTYFCDGTKLQLEQPQLFKEYLEKRIEVKMLYGTKIW